MGKLKYFYKEEINKGTNEPGEIKNPKITGIALVPEGANEEQIAFFKIKNFKKEEKKMKLSLAK